MKPTLYQNIPVEPEQYEPTFEVIAPLITEWGKKNTGLRLEDYIVDKLYLKGESIILSPAGIIQNFLAKWVIEGKIRQFIFTDSDFKITDIHYSVV